MRHFKNHRAKPGQTFIEVVLTVYMMGSLLSAILLLQSSVFSNVTGSVSRMNRLELLQKYLFDIDLDWKLNKTYPTKKTIDDPPTTLAYNITPPKQESSLKRFKNISVVRLEATWDQANRSFKEPLVALRHREKRAKV